MKKKFTAAANLLVLLVLFLIKVYVSAIIIPKQAEGLLIINIK